MGKIELIYTPQGGNDMKMSYNRTDDVLIFEVCKGVIDHAEEVGPIIVHFDKNGKPFLLEILDASEFLSETAKVTMKAKDKDFVEIAV